MQLFLIQWKFLILSYFLRKNSCLLISMYWFFLIYGSNDIFLKFFNLRSVSFWQLLPFPHRWACLHHTAHRTSRKLHNGWCYSVARHHNWRWCWLSGEIPFDIPLTQSWCKLLALQAEKTQFSLRIKFIFLAYIWFIILFEIPVNQTKTLYQSSKILKCFNFLYTAID